MKSMNLTNLLFLLLFAISANVISAQSDYEITQNFKNAYKQTEDEIKAAQSLVECQKIASKIDSLQQAYSSHKDLLDKTLYPDNFAAVFEKLNKEVEVRKGDFTQIVDLTSQVGELKTKVQELNEESAALLNQIKDLQNSRNKDAATIASLQKLVASLKASIKERDDLVMAVVDSLMQQFVKNPFALNDADRKQIFAKVESNNLFFNIERTISDNIQFVKVTSLKPEDLAELKDQQKSFYKAWKQLGPKLAEVYMDKKDRALEIEQIDSRFKQWELRINGEIWNGVNKDFRQNRINLLAYNTGDEFTNSVSTFIDDEIKNVAVRRQKEAAETFDLFADSVWFAKTKPVWIPLLIDKGMLTTAQKDTIESRIARWKEVVEPASSNMWL